ncbi:unnamed protein product [Rotaria magnacalcarata]|uniref:Peptidase C14 caspase domain-containing protein n=1 Tax=Rotaria magnacalcarata TaxID=392030 RepID=A0A816LNY4_9BILA|nr:unnamed protein product [Rotaria magnacalcarata]CAF3941856.1 unnamed protein product [Rotaria magnacalcarata]
MARQATNFQRKRALVIGINDYYFNPLEYCVRDAQDFSEALKSIGFEVTPVVNCSLKEFTQVLKAFLDKTRSTDLVLFYFAGHIKVHKYENYLILANYNPGQSKNESKNMTEGTISIESIMKQMAHKNCCATIFIFDCCRKHLNSLEENTQQRCLSMKGTSKTLIVYSNCPGAVIRSETGDGKNGYLMGNLLKHIINTNVEIQDILTCVAQDLRKQTSEMKALYLSREFNQKIFLATTKDQDPIVKPMNASRVMNTPRGLPGTEQPVGRNNELWQATNVDVYGERTPQRTEEHVISPRLAGKDKNVGAGSHGSDARSQGVLSSSVSIDRALHQVRTPNPYPSEAFCVDASISKEIRALFQYLTYELPVMNKRGPMSGNCVPETDQMEQFLKQNFGFNNTNDYIVSGVRSFQIRRFPSDMDSRQTIYFPREHQSAFAMTVSEIKTWQSSYAVYADRNIRGMDKAFLQKALRGKSGDGDEAFRMKFVVRISDCPILMKFDARILRRSLEEKWPHLIKLVSVTGVDFAGRKHDVNDVTTYIKNWQEVFELDPKTGKPAVFHGRDFYPVRHHPQAMLDENRLLEDLARMVRLRLQACDQEGVEIVVETGIGLGVFAGKHIGIDGQVRRLSASAIRHVLQNYSTMFKNIRAIVLALPIFSGTRDGRRLPDTYDYFVEEFRASQYSGHIPVLIIDQDMHELTVAIALGGYRVSQLNPADSHGVFGEYWQNHGPAVEEKLALTTVGLLVQHHLINPAVLDENRYHII